MATAIKWKDRKKKNVLWSIPCDSITFAKMKASKLEIPTSEYITRLIDADWDETIDEERVQQNFMPKRAEPENI